MTFTARLAGRVYDVEQISISFGGVTLTPAAESQLGYVVIDHEYGIAPEHEAVKRTVAAALKRHQNYFNLETMRSVVIRGRVTT